MPEGITHLFFRCTHITVLWATICPGVPPPHNPKALEASVLLPLGLLRDTVLLLVWGSSEESQ
jgi:hypothetical protein